MAKRNRRHYKLCSSTLNALHWRPPAGGNLFEQARCLHFWNKSISRKYYSDFVIYELLESQVRESIYIYMPTPCMTLICKQDSSGVLGSADNHYGYKKDILLLIISCSEFLRHPPDSWSIGPLLPYAGKPIFHLSQNTFTMFQLDFHMHSSSVQVKPFRNEIIANKTCRKSSLLRTVIKLPDRS